MKTGFFGAVVAGVLCLGAAPRGEETIWVEGENPARSTFRKHGWYDNVKKDILSGKEWHSHYAGTPGEASYSIGVKEGGEYTFWIRCNNLRVTQHYRIDGGEWTLCDLRSEPREQVTISPRPDHRNMAWHKLGRVKLDKGTRTVTFRLTSGTRNHGGIDCFVLTNSAYVPSGTRKPSERVAAGPDVWFEVLPDDDAFSARSIIDMSKLVPKPAGKFGFVTRTGKDLTVGGRPIKFWGCGGNINAGKSRAWQEQWARYLAKHGVNMIRQHPVMAHLGPLRNGAFDKQRLDQWDRWFATLKKTGIYMTWSMFYPYWVSPSDGYSLFDDLPSDRGRGGARSSSGLVTIVPELQDLEWRYTKALLLHKNPYTGIRYIDDPGLAVLEIRNEDSIFWHAPLNDVATGKRFPKHAARIKQRWAAWLKKRYGSDAELRKAWGSGAQRGDSVDNPNMRVYGAWEMNSDGPRSNAAGRKRVGDWIRFLAEAQREGYARREKLLRDLGFKAVTVTTAWRAGGPAADPANLWTDDAMDMIDRHNYLGGGAGGHDVKEGKVNNQTHLATPGGGLLAIGLYQIEDKPYAITEWTQLTPNQWKAEAAPLMAFYGMGLQGWDASYHFLSGRSRMGAGWPNMRSYVTDTPHYIGQFPAIAFALYKGHIQEGPIAAARRLKIDPLFGGVDPLGQDFTGGGYDDKAVKGTLATPQEILAVGRVTAKFADEVAKPEKSDWSRYWDREKKTIKSMTGELTWDYGRRIVTLTTRKTQAVLGFAGGTSHDLPGARVEVRTPFVSLIFTPLDDRPLIISKNILITALAKDKQTGTRYSEDGSQLISAGRPPLLLEPVQAKITLKGAAPTEVRAVDIYGVPTSRMVPVSGRTFTIDGRYQAYYYQVKR